MGVVLLGAGKLGFIIFKGLKEEKSRDINRIVSRHESNDNWKSIKNKFKKVSFIVKIISIIFAALLLVSAMMICTRYSRIYLINKGNYNILMKETLDVDTFYDGIYVENVNLGGKTINEAKELLIEKEKALRDNVNIKFNSKGKTSLITQDDFDYIYNTDEILKEAYSLGRYGENWVRYNQILHMHNVPVYLNIECKFDESSINKAVEKVLNDINVLPQDAKVSTFNILQNPKFTYKDGVKGFEVNRDEVAKDISDILSKEDKTGDIDLTTVETNYSVTAKDLKDRNVLLSSFSTVSSNNLNGNHNMGLALKITNGSIIEDGSLYSFNEKTGDTTDPSNGYLLAGAILNGKMIQSYGGGICQASTTIYGAAIRADLDIVERSNHSWKSAYVRIGLDAAINYPRTDLKFRNNTGYPIYIGSYMKGTVLTCEIYGYKSFDYDNVDVKSHVTEVIPPPETKYIKDSSLPSGKRVVEMKSKTGYKAEAEVVFYKEGKEVKRKILPPSYYKEAAGIVRVGTQGE